MNPKSLVSTLQKPNAPTLIDLVQHHLGNIPDEGIRCLPRWAFGGTMLEGEWPRRQVTRRDPLAG